MIVLRYVIQNHHMQAVQPTIVQLRFSPCHADRLLSTRPYTCQYQQSRRTGPTSVSGLVPDNCEPLNHWSYHVEHWLHRHTCIIHWFMASNCSKIKCPCCIMDTPLAPSPLKPSPPLIQTLLVVHCQQTCEKEIRAGEYSTHKCAEEPGPSDADVQLACHTGFHQL